MKLKVKVALCLLSALIMQGCRTRDGQKREASFGISDLVGTWSVNCAPSAFGQLTAYRIAVLQITDSGNFIYQDSHYGDDKCMVKYYEESSVGKVTLGQSIDATGKRISIVGSEGTGTAKSDTVVTAANILEICGYKNWVKDQPQKLMGTECIGWSEANTTDGIDLIDTSEGKKQIQVFRFSSSGAKERIAGDDFTKD